MKKSILVATLLMFVLSMGYSEVQAASGFNDGQVTLTKKKDKKDKKKKSGKTFNAQKHIDKILKLATELSLTSDQQTKIKALSNITSKKEFKKALKKILDKAQRKKLKELNKAAKAAKKGKKGKKKNK